MPMRHDLINQGEPWLYRGQNRECVTGALPTIHFLDTFMCANYTLETVNPYCYLGVTFKHTGSLTHTSTLLMEKAKKSLFKIKNTIGLDNPCNLLEKLFDNLVIPVMLYCSEIWGVICQVNNSTPYEYLHL